MLCCVITTVKMCCKLDLNVVMQLREFHARPFPEIIYSSAPSKSAHSQSAAAAAPAQDARKKPDCSQPKVHNSTFAFVT